MQSTLKLENMSIEEKIQTMEFIWEDLCKTADKITSPPWHKKILDEREQNILSGSEKYIDWEIAKKDIRKNIS